MIPNNSALVESRLLKICLFRNAITKNSYCYGIPLFVEVVICVMAKQTGEHTITGSIDNLCFYKMEEKFYVRQKSSLTGRRVKNDAAFAQTMHYAGLLATASKAASVVYRKMTAAQKEKGLYRKMTGAVMQYLKEGMTPSQAVAALESIYCTPRRRKKKAIITKPLSHHFYLQHMMHEVFTERLPASYVTVTRHLYYLHT